MLIIAIDPVDKCIVRGVFEPPTGLTIEKCESMVAQAFELSGMDESNKPPIEFLNEMDTRLGLEDWVEHSYLTVEV